MLGERLVLIGAILFFIMLAAPFVSMIRALPKDIRDRKKYDDFFLPFGIAMLILITSLMTLTGIFIVYLLVLISIA